MRRLGIWETEGKLCGGESTKELLPELLNHEHILTPKGNCTYF